MIRQKALVVGIDNYPKAALHGCVNDATEVASLLKKNGDGSPNFSVILETDIPVKGTLKAMIKELFDGDADAALFYFSGHGSTDETGGFLVTPDYSNNDLGVSMEEVLKLANESKIKNRIVILDCCKSGRFGMASLTKGRISSLNEGVTILTASSDKEAARELNGHGLFTQLLLDALHGGAADLQGYISPGSIYAHIDQSMGIWGQRPEFKTNISYSIPLRKVDPPVPLEVMRRITYYFPEPESEFSLDPSFEYSNSPDEVHEIVKPYADAGNVAIFKELQKMQGARLIVPVGAPHMYHAAMESKSCKLTALGYHYWKMVKKDKL